MIVTSIKPYGIIKGMLKKWKKTGIISCNSCARVCETGGKKKMEEFQEKKSLTHQEFGKALEQCKYFESYVMMISINLLNN